MTEKFTLSLNDLSITFKTLSTSQNNNSIQFYLSFFNRFPELISDNSAEELNILFWKLFPQSKHLFQLQDNASKFVTMINNANFTNLPIAYQESVKEESILYIHSSARVIFDFVFQITNQDMFLVIDKLVNKINYLFQFNEYIIPWSDYTKEKLDSIDFELSKMSLQDSEQKYIDYFQSLLTQPINLIHRASEKMSIEDDYTLQTILSQFYFNSLPEEQNLVPYLLKKLIKDNNYTNFEIHSFIPINNEYAINFIIPAKLINDELVFGTTNHIFFNLIVKSLGSYFSKTSKDSNLFIRAINPNVNIISYTKNMTKEENHLNEIFGFFFNQDFAFGLNKVELKKILEHDLYTLKYKNPKPGTFYSDSADLFSQYATDKAISLILGNIKLYQK